MARAGRSFEEGRIYHVYNRVGGGSREFADEELAATFVTLLRLAMGRVKWRVPATTVVVRVLDPEGQIRRQWSLSRFFRHDVARSGWRDCYHQGLMTLAPVRSRSVTLRVTTTHP